MSLIPPPTPFPLRRAQWTLKQPHQVNRSGWTGRRQVLTTPGGSYWSVGAELVPIRGQAAANAWIGFFHSLEGQLHKFPVIAVEQPQHGGGFTHPMVAAGVAGARTLTTVDLPPPLRAGSRMTVKLIDGTYQLVTLTALVLTNTIAFIPPLRNTAATGAGSLETRLPFAHVSLTADAWQYSVDQGQVYSFSFDAEESF